MGELSPGDTVFDASGKTCRVKAASDVFTDHDCYRVSFSASMKIGKLRHRITIEQVSDTQATDGAVLQNWSTYATVHASIEPVSGREYFAAQSTQADVTHRISLRYLSGIVPKMRVKFGSRLFDILSIINVGERNRELQLMCRESIG